MDRRYTAEDEAFYRDLMLPQEEEDIPPDMPAQMAGAFRWFRSPNVVCIEHYRRRPTASIRRTNPAA
jgi:hypothetical protein